MDNYYGSQGGRGGKNYTLDDFNEATGVGSSNGYSGDSYNK